MSDKKDSSCVFRWDQSVINFSTSGVTTCCRTMPVPVTRDDIKKYGKEVFLNSDHLIARREEMLRGERHSSCRECWDIETQGHASFRKTQHSESEPWNRFLDRVGDSARPSVSRKVESMILYIGNTCDLKCIYCGNYLSTSWAAEDLKFGKITKQYYDELTATVEGLDDVFWEFFEDQKENVRHISFVGGEPLTMKRTYDVLDRISEIYKGVELSNLLTLGITTNLNANQKTFSTFLNSLKKLDHPFFRIKIDGSIDTVGERAALIRSGISWDRWRENFIRLLELDLPGLVYTVIPSVSALSVTSFGELFRELGELQRKYKKQILIQENIIMTPQFLSPYVLPQEYARFIEEAAGICREENLRTEMKTDYAQFLEKIAHAVKSGDERISHSKYRRELHRFLADLNHRRGTDHRKTFPEMEDFFRLCESEEIFHRIGMTGGQAANKLTISKDTTEKDSHSELRIPLDASVPIDSHFETWFRKNGKEFRRISFFRGDPTTAENFAEILSGLEQVMISSGNVLPVNIRTDLSGKEESYLSFVGALKRTRVPSSVSFFFPNPGDRGQLVSKAPDFRQWPVRLRSVLAIMDVPEVEILLPVYFFSLPDLPALLKEIREAVNSCGRKLTIRRGEVPLYLSSDILSGTPFEKEFPDYISPLEKWEVEKRRAQFLQFLEKSEAAEGTSFGELYPEFGLLVSEWRELQILGDSEWTLAAAEKSLTALYPQFRNFLRSDPTDRSLTEDYHRFLCVTLDFLFRGDFFYTVPYAPVIKAHARCLETRAEEDFAQFREDLYYFLSPLPEERRKLFLTLFPDLQRAYKQGFFERVSRTLG